MYVSADRSILRDRVQIYLSVVRPIDRNYGSGIFKVAELKEGTHQKVGVPPQYQRLEWKGNEIESEYGKIDPNIDSKRRKLSRDGRDCAIAPELA